MNRFRLIYLLMLMMGLLVGCGNSEESTKPVEKKKEVESVAAPKSTSLGSEMSTFEEKYGKNTGDEMMARFNKDIILGLFTNGKAMNLTYQFEATDKPRRTKEEALEAMKELMLSDAVEVKQSKDEGNSRDIIVYKSETLAKTFDASIFGGAEPGTFIAILKYDDKGYFSVILGIGNTP